MLKPSSIIKIPTSYSDFFKNWLIMLKPFHELTARQIEVAAAFLKERQELSSVISDETLLDENVMSEKTKDKIIKECGCKKPHFQVILGDLKRQRFIIDNKINPRYIPKLNKDNDKSFTLMIYFPFTND